VIPAVAMNLLHFSMMLQICEGIALTFQAPFRHTLAAPRLSPVTLAYNPGARSRPKKLKNKAPKEKVKGPPSAAAVQQLIPEQTFWEGPPSITETIIPGISLFTVIGAIPFSAAIARQAWTRYKITNKRLEVCSGFQGKDVVQITWREVTDVKWLRRFGGSCGDVVISLRDGAKLEMRSLPEFDRNMAFIMDQLLEGVAEDSGYPDQPARDFLDKVASGEEPPVELLPLSAASSESSTSVA